MLEKSEDYQQRAVYCRQMAEEINSESLKVGWLELAQIWLDMARQYGEEGLAALPLPRAH